MYIQMDELSISQLIKYPQAISDAIPLPKLVLDRDRCRPRWHRGHVDDDEFVADGYDVSLGDGFVPYRHDWALSEVAAFDGHPPALR